MKDFSFLTISQDKSYDDNGLIIDNSHVHDNRYYTKENIDNIIAEVHNEFDSRNKTLSAGLGLISADYDTTQDIVFNLDFLEKNDKNGKIDKPSRVDHAHEKLILNEGFIQKEYNGYSETIANLDFAGFGTSTQVSRSDHTHFPLVNGYGIKALSYNGSNQQVVEIDELQFADVNHNHKILTAGNGLIKKYYDGTYEEDFSADYAGFGEDYGISIQIARADHKHSQYTTFDDTISRIEHEDNKLLFKNAKNELITDTEVYYSRHSSASDKLTTEREIKLIGAIHGNVLFDGTKNIQIDTIFPEGKELIHKTEHIYTYPKELFINVPEFDINFRTSNLFIVQLNNNTAKWNFGTNWENGFSGKIIFYGLVGIGPVELELGENIVTDPQIQKLVFEENNKYVYEFLIVDDKLILDGYIPLTEEII